MNCPVCHDQPLADEEPGQRSCGKCRGTWVTVEKLEAMLHHAAPHADPPLGVDSITAHDLPPQIAAKHIRNCPECSAPMTAGTLLAVLVDRCASGHGVWVDTGELSRIVLAARRHDRR
jgi:Zn-finger nucleic acid-binding protein